MTTLLTVTEVALALGVGEQWVRDQVALGAPHVRRRDEPRFAPSHYEHLLRLAASCCRTSDAHWSRDSSARPGRGA